ncbi:ATP-dependent DNA helicase [Alloscardovia macacae]|uniref:ATP-dependent DNA helicase n=1 Tax=Alloscardovia macacae TaxID=1160091 RepID=A0A1Y2SWF7_9BIFI|nr:UvrD-helicase domain-containing protein [Alloscardovia macacae]OTA27565.1 ATP-dependent DNA helicase [Alloscardovia macacae]OTA30295.1 ATP-dependent DNA helicase [Alloscardovia macacae]
MVDAAYARLDEIRELTKKRLADVRGRGAHGSPTQRSERDSFATMYEDRLYQLRSVEDRLVFGRIDTDDDKQHHIGRIGLQSENHESILVDWRAEAARPFYEATPRHRGNISMRRHITLKFRDVVAIEDEVLDVDSEHVASASESGTLTGEGALLASLSTRRTGKMTDIVATIQGEQDSIIRSPLTRPLVVQGGPGTGKTAVALHRAAYLLYTHRSTLQNSGVLIVGPSPAFLHYIDQVLPSLGETGVISRTLGDLIPGIHATAVDEPFAARVKGSKRMAKAIANAVASRVRIPSELPVLPVNGVRVPITRADIEEAQGNARRSRQPHNLARNTFVKSMISLLMVRYREALDYEPEATELDGARSTLQMSDTLRRVLNTAWLPMNAPWLVNDMLSKPHRIRQFAPWLKDNEVSALTRPSGSPFTVSDVPLLDEAFELLGPDPHEQQRSSARDDAESADESYVNDMMASMGLSGSGVSARTVLDHMNDSSDLTLSERAGADREWTYGHVVVDEAQELTQMDWRMLLRRCPSRSFTIVGDVAQTTALGGTHSWKTMLNPFFGADGWDLNELTIDYRNPQEVSDIAGQFAAAEGLYISTVSAVRAVEGSVERSHVSNMSTAVDSAVRHTINLMGAYVSSDGTGRVALICDPSVRDSIDKQLRLSMKNSEDVSDEEFARLTSQPAWDAQVGVYVPTDVKGLEFDAVVLCEPGLIAQNSASRLSAAADLYVAMTRPTQKLVIVQTEEDSARIAL